MKGFIFLMLISLPNFSFAGDLTQGGGGGSKIEPKITDKMMVYEKFLSVEDLKPRTEKAISENLLVEGSRCKHLDFTGKITE